VKPLHVGRGARPTAPEAGALPETRRYLATFQKSKKTESHCGLRMGYGVGVGVGGGRTGRALPTAGADGTAMLPFWVKDWDATTADSPEALSDP
jgi:hypothetical protein